MEMSESKIIEIFERLGGIDAKLDALAKPGAICAVHTEQLTGVDRRLADVERRVVAVQTVVGKKELVVACFGALGFGFARFVRYLWTKVAA